MKLSSALAYVAASVTLIWCTIAHAATTITYYHNDLLGSPVAATDASAHVIWRESYRPYGERLTNDPASTGNDVWYTSRRQDADTGLVYMGARYYDPVVGRFVSKDPVGFDEGNVQSFNRYAYANDNPYKYVDPNGRTGALATAALGAEAGTLVWPGPGTIIGGVVGLGVGIWGTYQVASWLHDEGNGSSSGATGAQGSTSSASGMPDPDDDDGRPKLVTNPKHHANSDSPQPENVQDLYDNSVMDAKGVRWAKDADGTIHRFARETNGETHWNGSTAGSDPIQNQNIPINIKRLFNVKG